MGVIVYDKNFEKTNYVDEYESLLWTIRYCDICDFELYTNASERIASILKEGYYLSNSYGRFENDSDSVAGDDNRWMIIEGIKTQHDEDGAKKMIFSGRGLESILDRRIVWGQRLLYGDPQACIKALIEENVINPSLDKRKIPNFVFKEVTDSRITDQRIDTQYTGDNLLDAIIDICSSCTTPLGFKVVINENNQFEFSLYYGTDRSFSEDRDSYVKFAPSFDNLYSSEYYESKQTFKNVTLVAGEGEGQERRYVSVGTEDTGLDRREVFTDARDISSTVEEGQPPITNEEYNNMLAQRGMQKLYEDENIVTRTFDGKIDPRRSFELNIDYYLGDIIQLSDDMGHNVSARISELIYSEDESGSSFYPSFVVLDETLSSDGGTSISGESTISGHGSSYLRPSDIYAITFPQIDDIVV